MSKKTTNSVVKVITYILVILVFVGAVGAIFKFTNGFNEDFKTFYLEYQGESILTSNKQLVLDRDVEHKFGVKYTFDTNTGEAQGYSVKIVPNADSSNSFDFTIDGETYAYYGEKDLTDAFDLVMHDTYFTLTFPKDMTIQTVLQNLYPDSEITVSEEANKMQYPFTLVVSSYNGEVTYNLDFCFYLGVSGVEIDKEVIQF